MIAIKVSVLVLITVVLVYVSRAPLRERRSHGFYRFFAWEAIAALAILNIDAWFRDPLAWHQLISWLLLIASGVLVVWGMLLIKRRGRPAASRADPSLIAIEKTTSLVTTGLYRSIRHPLYSSLLFLAWGIFFKAPSWAGGLLAAAATLFLVATARVEEAENVRYFGVPYREYMKHSRMFVPFLF